MFSKFTNRVKETWKQLFEEITVAEYVMWWIFRLMMLYALIFHPDPSERVMCFINMLALYAMSAIRFIAPRKTFISRLDFRCQHIINFFEFLGTFCGNFLNAYAYIHKYDRILHFLSGFGAVIAGYYIYKAFASKDGKKKYYSPGLGAFCGVSFSFVIICMWEITEFLGDFLYDTQNQGYLYSPPDNDIMFRIFNHKAVEGQFPLWDTMMDMIDASIATFIAGIAMAVVLTLWKKHIEKKESDKIKAPLYA
ncbi:MAG: hypothetical protein NC122_08705 [Faecalibacterium sp.]|nr:hypothetical protein [Ruminococcus sp.]MCM1392582.1 hypothetical protein [Ruminococcus sp.]MCM1486274.1 hypothetical protein [Faecalibacterium sp.]